MPFELPVIKARASYRVGLRYTFGAGTLFPNATRTLIGWTPDSTALRFLGMSRTGRVERWDIDSGECHEGMELSTEALIACVAAHRSYVLISQRGVGDRFTVTLWDLDSGRSTVIIKSRGSGTEIVASRGAPVVAVWSFGRSTVYALPGGEPLGTAPGRPVAIAADGSLLVTRNRAGSSLSIWSISEVGAPTDPQRPLRPALERAGGGTSGARLKVMNRSGLRTVFISRDNREVVMAFADATLAGVELATGRPLWSSRWSGGTFERSFDVSPDGSTYFAILAAGQLVAVGADGQTRWSVPLTWRQGREFVGFPLFVAAAPDGTVVAVTAIDGGVRVLDAATGDERAVLGGHDGRVAEIALSADGGLCASASSLGHVRVHDLSTGEDVWLFESDGGFPRSLEFLPDRAEVRSCYASGAIRHWNLRSGLEGQRRFVHSRVWGARGSPDGARAFRWGDQEVALWDCDSPRQAQWSHPTRVDGDYQRFHGAAFSADGSRVVVATTASARQEITTFDVATGVRVGGPWPTRAAFVSLVSTADGPVSIMFDEGVVWLVEEWGERFERTLRVGLARVRFAHLSADRRWLLLGDDHWFDVWDLAREGARLAAEVETTESRDRFTAYAMSSGGDVVAVGTARGYVLVYSVEATE